MMQQNPAETSDPLLQRESAHLWNKDENEPKIIPANSMNAHELENRTEVIQPDATEEKDIAEDDTDENNKGSEKEDAMVYEIEDVPEWYMTILLALQNFLMMAPACAAAPILLASHLCLLPDNPARGYIVTTIFFISGVVTLFQTAFGCRLPIIQGPSVAVLIPLIALFGQPQWKCPEEAEIRNMTFAEETEVWQLRMREAQGAVIVASVLEVLLGATGAIGLLLRWITPLVITPVITMIALSLADVVSQKAGSHWGISGLCILLIVIMTQYLKHITIPVPMGKGKGIYRLPIFALFPVIIAIIVGWIVCVILTATDVFAEDNPANTEKDISLVHETPWFYFPYPGQFGTPTFSAGAIVGVMAGILASVIESVGDYYACAGLSGAPAPPAHAINRGVLFEGLGSVLSGCYGSGVGVTSFSTNIAAIGITRVASRRVMQAAAVIMVISGFIGKIGAVFVTMPEAVQGGMFVCVVGMIAAVGLSTLKYVNLHSSRNLFILGLSLFLSMVFHSYLEKNPRAIDTGSFIVDNIISILLKTTMFSAGLIGFILDNTVPGTPEERGIHKWQQKHGQKRRMSLLEDGRPCILGDVLECKTTYDVPGMAYLRRWSWTHYVPFSPTFRY